jgi:hypothetical protein
VPGYERGSFTSFVCICPEGFSGETCENKDVKIDISFPDVSIPQSLLVHFITVRPFVEDGNNPMPVRSTMFKKIPLDHDKVTFHMSFAFHLVFAQIKNTLYLAILQKDMV